MEDIWVWLVMQVVLVLSIYLVAKRAKTSGTQEVKKTKAWARGMPGNAGVKADAGPFIEHAPIRTGAACPNG